MNTARHPRPRRRVTTVMAAALLWVMFVVGVGSPPSIAASSASTVAPGAESSDAETRPGQQSARQPEQPSQPDQQASSDTSPSEVQSAEDSQALTDSGVQAASADADDIDDPAQGGPSCQLTVAPSLAHWAGQLKLSSKKPGRFGETRGEVRLHESRDPGSPSYALQVTSWQEGSISARLPSAPPASQDKKYYVSVTRGNKPKACGFLSMASEINLISPLELPACVFTPTPASAQWGDQLVLDALDPTLGGFGNTQGTVRIHDVVDTSIAIDVPQSQVQWTGNTLSVTLPAERPAGLPDALAYDISVIRAGASDPCGWAPFSVPSGCDFLAEPAALRWGNELTLNATLEELGAHFGTAKGTVRLGAGNQTAQAVEIMNVDWGKDTIVATLPQTRPDELPDAESYTVTVTRAGATTHCGSHPLVVTSIACDNVPGYLSEGWRLSDGKDEIVLDAPAGPSYAIDPARPSPHFKVLQQEVQNNPLIEGISAPETGIGVRFGFFRTADSSADDFKVEAGKLSFDEFLPSLELQTLLRPEVVPAIGNGPQTKEWTITLRAEATVPGCDLTVINLSLTLRQMPLVLPAIAAFFEHSEFGGDAFVAIYADDAMLKPLNVQQIPPNGTFVDACTGDPDGRIDQLVTALRFLAGDLNIITSAFDNLPTDLRLVEQAKALSGMANRLDDGRKVAIDARGDVTDLHDVYRTCPDWWFRDNYAGIFSSGILFGVPVADFASSWMAHGQGFSNQAYDGYPEGSYADFGEHGDFYSHVGHSHAWCLSGHWINNAELWCSEAAT